MDLRRAFFLYKLIAKNQRCQVRRHPMFEKNVIMKIVSYFIVAFWAVYLMVLGVSFHSFFKDSSLEAFDWIDGGLVWFLILDFFSRFMMQDTPAQNVKQYKLLNIPNHFLLHVFLLRIGMQFYNLFWAFFFIPFGILSVPQFYGVEGLVGFWLGWWLLFVLNSYWYLFWRTLMNRNMLWGVCPFLLYLLCLYLGIFYDTENQWLFEGSIYLMRGFCQWSTWCWLLLIVGIIVMYIANFYLQKVAVYMEISKVEHIGVVKTRNMKFLDRYGVVGEYMKLEIKSMMRNLVIRKLYINGGLCMLMLCGLFSFSGIYDELPFMRVFICVYCFSCLGVMTLTTIMCAEGNYLDGLMVHKETVFSLLKAKYYFQCTVLLVPVLFSLMPIVEGKMPVLTMLACAFFTSGIVFPFIFQLAVYNDSSIHLNKKLTRSGRNTKVQMLMSAAAMFLPMLIMYVLVEVFGETCAAIVMLSMGVIGTILHPLWLKNIYQRFMKRRYQNMDGFRNSR
jgi:hypothetical protein